MKKIVNFLMIVFTTFSFSQTKIEGKVIDKKQHPISGANVFIEGTYDGSTTLIDGTFYFETYEKGAQNLIINQLGFDELKVPINIENNQINTYILKTTINALDAVTITAGTIKAGDNSKASALKPLDILTTAGALGDVVGAFQTMPGAQINGESGRLFVRGGESDETQTYIDGIRVAQPYGVTPNNLPTRSRFSPLLFNGMTFSTGGYSAEFGDALSSVLLMNTINEPEIEKTDFAIMSIGTSIGKTKKWKKGSLSLNTSYINLGPYQWLIPQNIQWNKPYQTLGGESILRQKLNNGIFKFYVALDHSSFDLNQTEIGTLILKRIHNTNNNLYLNSFYKKTFIDNWTLTTGGSLGRNEINMFVKQDDLYTKELATHLKLKIDKKFSNRFTLSFGGDYFYTRFNEKYTLENKTEYKLGYQSQIGALFAESDLYLSNDFALKLGTRFTYNSLINQKILEPRASLAYKISKNNQFSFAYGDFHQAPKQDYLKYTASLDFEDTHHYILNYLYTANKRTLRAEFYFKNYKNLIKYNTIQPLYNSQFTNTGHGYAQGIDLFWRDNNTFKKLEYWISYSYIDSKRDFKNYLHGVTPPFVANHTLSLVGKYWIEEWKSQISITNSFATGRPYNNPNESQFMNGKTKAYNNLSLSWAYLLTTQKILYFSISNVLGRDNVFGYQYAPKADSNGVFQRETIAQPANRFFFIGFFWTISKDKKNNQLENL
ncbi:TonB-dependent receptor [Flavobacterium columnare]|uniref:TonB-dependent receptor n=1 Tax=Flavobacterium columnare TaxID=996 RepID=UPI00189641B4|nr:carboxypeptidase-like regulatory domain-containing protein [Flavobacterium columnare]MBF6654126.1 TonB-dependent receptor [Flavobacterium columnare]MBF6657479.1 TonB-dependent receptor [Flavobacterium columnare]